MRSQTANNGDAADAAWVPEMAQAPGAAGSLHKGQGDTVENVASQHQMEPSCNKPRGDEAGQSCMLTHVMLHTGGRPGQKPGHPEPSGLLFRSHISCEGSPGNKANKYNCDWGNEET